MGIQEIAANYMTNKVGSMDSDHLQNTIRNTKMIAGAALIVACTLVLFGILAKSFFVLIPITLGIIAYDVWTASSDLEKLASEFAKNASMLSLFESNTSQPTYMTLAIADALKNTLILRFL